MQIWPSRSYRALKTRVANDPRLSKYLHFRFILNPEEDLDLQYYLSRLSLELPPVSDPQMTEEIFAYGNNLDQIMDPTERRLASDARESIKQILFPQATPQEESDGVWLVLTKCQR